MEPMEPMVTAETLLPVHTIPADEPHVEATKKPSSRLIALDIVRGFTVAVMILVDDVGSSYEQLDHSPWNGLTLADIVMPWFLFMVGNAMAFSFRNTERGGRQVQLKKVLTRSLKLFLLGLLLQGGGLPRHTWQTWGFDLSSIRWCGILQRIAFAYLIVALTKVYAPVRPAAGELRDLLAVYKWQWVAPLVCTTLYLVLMLATPVPDWRVADTPISHEHEIVGAPIACKGVRANLGPACNAAGYYDRLLFGQSHMYQPGEKVRLPVCSTCSPGQCWAHEQHAQPSFCWAPFDPEGAVASLMTILTTSIGLHFGHAVQLARGSARTLLQMWGASIALCAALALVLVPAFPINKQLWTPSYALLNAAMTGTALLAVYWLCDVLRLRIAVYVFRPFQWVGMNALLVFVFGASDVLDTLVDAVYVHDPRHTLTWLLQQGFEEALPGSSPWKEHAVARLVYVLCKIGFWMAVCGLLHRWKWYWKF